MNTKPSEKKDLDSAVQKKTPGERSTAKTETPATDAEIALKRIREKVIEVEMAKQEWKESRDETRALKGVYGDLVNELQRRIADSGSPGPLFDKTYKEESGESDPVLKECMKDHFAPKVIELLAKAKVVTFGDLGAAIKKEALTSIDGIGKKTAEGIQLAYETVRAQRGE